MNTHSSITDHDLVSQLATSFATIWNRHDMEAFGELFAADAEFVNVAGMWWRGRQQIQQAHAHTHATFFKNSVLTSEVASLKFLAPEIAPVHLKWALIGHLEPDGQTGAPRRGVLVLTTAWQRGDGWRIAAAQNVNEVPQAQSRMARN